jgi:hypothetical protein
MELTSGGSAELPIYEAVKRELEQPTLKASRPHKPAVGVMTIIRGKAGVRCSMPPASARLDRP